MFEKVINQANVAHTALQAVVPGIWLIVVNTDEQSVEVGSGSGRFWHDDLFTLTEQHQHFIGGGSKCGCCPCTYVTRRINAIFHIGKCGHVSREPKATRPQQLRSWSLPPIRPHGKRVSSLCKHTAPTIADPINR